MHAQLCEGSGASTCYQLCSAQRSTESVTYASPRPEGPPAALGWVQAPCRCGSPPPKRLCGWTLGGAATPPGCGTACWHRWHRRRRHRHRALAGPALPSAPVLAAWCPSIMAASSWAAAASTPALAAAAAALRTAAAAVSLPPAAAAAWAPAARRLWLSVSFRALACVRPAFMKVPPATHPLPV